MTPARPVVVAMLGLLIGASAGPGSAAQHPRGLMASAAKSKGCTIETRPLSFGTYDPLATTALDALGQVVYTCGEKGEADQRAVKNIRIEISRGSSSSYDRAMTTGGDHLRYNVYLDASHRTVWGDGSNGTDYYFDSHPPNKTPVTVPAYGHIFAMQDVVAGQYTDVLQVTILF